MIAALRGLVRRVGLDYAIIGAGPMDVRVSMPLTAVRALPAEGSSVHIFTHLYVREDVLALYGFLSEDDLALFELLLTVQNVGPRLALGLLSAIPAADLRHLLATGDEVALTRAPGVGRRTAARLVLELRERVGQIEMGTTTGGAVEAELVEALIGWGYRRPEAERVLRLPEIAAVVDPGTRLAAAAARLLKRD